MFSNNKENTYYMSSIPDLVNNNTYLKNEYDKQVGFFGKKLVESPYFSDKTKLDLIKHVKPEYKNQINLLEKGLPYIKKTQDFSNKYLSDNEPFAKENYQLYSNYVVGGRKTKRSNKKKRNTQKRNTQKRNTQKRNKSNYSKMRVKQIHK